MVLEASLRIINIVKKSIMKPNIMHKILKFGYFTLLIVLISLVVQFWIPGIKISNVWPYILLFLFSFTSLAIFMLSKYIGSKISYFANAFMLVNFGKLVLFSTIIVIYAWLNRDEAISFTITFFVYYLALTAYEIITLLKMQKRD